MPYKITTQDPTLPQGFNNNFRKRFWKYVDTFKHPKGCWTWIGFLDKNGYGQINKGNNRCVFSHRASWLIHYGEIPDNLGVLHHCDNPACVNPKHLWLGTQTENMKDCFNKGRVRRGENHPKAVLTLKEVRKIRKLSASGLRNFEISKITGVRHRQISRIVLNQRWRDA